jgi:hypothetical protein
MQWFFIRTYHGYHHHIVKKHGGRVLSRTFFFFFFFCLFESLSFGSWERDIFCLGSRLFYSAENKTHLDGCQPDFQLDGRSDFSPGQGPAREEIFSWKKSIYVTTMNNYNQNGNHVFCQGQSHLVSYLCQPEEGNTIVLTHETFDKILTESVSPLWVDPILDWPGILVFRRRKGQEYDLEG